MVENKVSERRHALGMTQEQLAKKSGIGQSTVAEVESGKHIPIVDVALKIAKALDRHVEELFFLG